MQWPPSAVAAWHDMFVLSLATIVGSFHRDHCHFVFHYNSLRGSLERGLLKAAVLKGRRSTAMVIDQGSMAQFSAR